MLVCPHFCQLRSLGGRFYFQSLVRSGAANRSVSGYLTSLEAMSSMLIPLPFALVSLILCSQSSLSVIHPTQAKLNGSIKEQQVEEMTSGSQNLSSLITLCALVSGTLLLVGVVGKWQGKSDALDRRKRSHSSLGHRDTSTKTGLVLSPETARRIVRRILAIGLPIFGASIVGGPGPAIILLVATAGDLANSEGSTGHNGKSIDWIQPLRSRKWTLTVISFQIGADLARAIIHEIAIWPIFIGYTAVVVSAFMLPPPYSTLRVAASAITSPMPKSTVRTSAVLTPWEASQAKVKSLTEARARSPLISTPKDTNLTLVAGFLTALPCAAWLLFIFPRTTQIAFMPVAAGFTICTFSALSFIFAYPKSLMNENKLGVAAGLVLPIILQEILNAQSWLRFAFQGVIVGLFWFALNVDTLLVQRIPHTASAHIHHHGSKSAKGPHSRFTGLLLATLRDWPLLHSILVEKDSRRIFYFMW